MSSRKLEIYFIHVHIFELTPCLVYNRYMIAVWWIDEHLFLQRQRISVSTARPSMFMLFKKMRLHNKVTTKSSHCSVFLMCLAHPSCYRHPRFPGEQHQVASHSPCWSGFGTLLLPSASFLLALQRSRNLQIHFLYITGAVSPSWCLTDKLQSRRNHSWWEPGDSLKW